LPKAASFRPIAHLPKCGAGLEGGFGEAGDAPRVLASPDLVAGADGRAGENPLSLMSYAGVTIASHGGASPRASRPIGGESRPGGACTPAPVCRRARCAIYAVGASLARLREAPDGVQRARLRRHYAALTRTSFSSSNVIPACAAANTLTAQAAADDDDISG
jgi:hypothetical protein